MKQFARTRVLANRDEDPIVVEIQRKRESPSRSCNLARTYSILPKPCLSNLHSALGTFLFEQ